MCLLVLAEGRRVRLGAGTDRQRGGVRPLQGRAADGHAQLRLRTRDAATGAAAEAHAGEARVQSARHRPAAAAAALLEAVEVPSLRQNS